MKNVAITGMGAITPLGDGARTLHARWAAGEIGIRDGEAPCAEFDPLDFFSKKEARRADRFTQFALAAAQEAIAEAGWADGAPYAPERIGCILGTGIGGIETLETNFGVLHDQGPRTCRAARGAADDGQRRSGRDRHAPRPARSGVRRRVGLRRGRQRDRRGRPRDPVRATPTRCWPAAPRRRSRRWRAPPSRALDATSTDRDQPPVRRRARRVHHGRGRRRPGLRGRSTRPALAVPRSSASCAASARRATRIT